MALLYGTLEEEGDDDVTFSLVIVHRQLYDESCTLNLKRLIDLTVIVFRAFNVFLKKIIRPFCVCVPFH